jgi:putative peptide zinc metalloprotease protein
VPAAQPLAPLRDDLVLLPAQADRLGTPGWMIHDPVRQRYFRIGAVAFELLSRWSIGSAAELARRVEAETVHRVSADCVLELQRFVHANQLIQRSGADAPAEFARIAAAGRGPLWQRILHGYLFFRIALWRPDRFLRRTQRLADALASRTAQRLIGALGIAGLLLTLRQWDRFCATLVEFASWQGVAWMGLALLGTKVLHELGHAYTAARYGCRVPTLGIAFMLLCPLLYTDTSDAWRLRSREQRLRIAAAGVRVELALALLATFFWHLLAPGALQSAVFAIASTTWVSTLLINLSPFMRFDGYYLLSDWLGIENLEQRSFALARWRLREWLLGLGAPPPEPLPEREQRLLVAFAGAVWIYRVFLFVGIALLVYHFFFKLLGLALFAAELIVFIARPIARELRVWAALRSRARPTPAGAAVAGLAALALALAAIPWRASVLAPALLRAGADSAVLSAAAGQIAEVFARDGQRVEAGAALVRMTSSALEHERALLVLQLEAAQIGLAQARAGGAKRADAPQLEQEALRLRAALQSIAAREGRLTLRAAIAGGVRELAPEARPGTWIALKTPLARIVDDAGPASIVAYVSQSDVARLREGAAATFTPDEPTLPSRRARIESVDRIAAGALEHPELASPHGGAILAQHGPDARVRALDAVYRVSALAVDAAPGGATAIAFPQRGTLAIEAPAASLLSRACERALSVLLRETNF